MDCARRPERRALEPRLTCAEQAPFTTHHRKIPVRLYRVLYRLMNAAPGLRNTSVDYRFTF
ncbi:hypothetical protein [Nonomuraea sp. B19D2]|uniref:hypothetical protein n=1 Tax=Nonomuraea sp. B19D2 TaxID=3159561 RepID=UPI0032DB8658